MTNVFIFPGIDSHPEDNWFPWLREELQKLGCRVIVPKFPTGKSQTLESTLAEFKKHREFYTPNAILVGHSLGGRRALHILERNPIQIRAAYMDAVYIGVPPDVSYDGKETFEIPPNWELIRTRAGKFYVFHSDNDPYVSVGNGQQLAQHLGADLIIVPDAGHFNLKSGYNTFPLLLGKIRQNI